MTVRAKGLTSTAVTVVLVATGSFGGVAHGSPTTQARSKRCVAVPAPALKAIRSSLKSGHQLGRAWAVQSRTSFSLPTLRGGYYVSIDVRPNPGISTWLVSRSFFRSGGGLAFGIDSAARAVSDLGDLANVSAMGLTTGDGLTVSRSCFR